LRERHKRKQQMKMQKALERINSLQLSQVILRLVFLDPSDDVVIADKRMVSAYRAISAPLRCYLTGLTHQALALRGSCLDWTPLVEQWSPAGCRRMEQHDHLSPPEVCNHVACMLLNLYIMLTCTSRLILC